ncbi:MAG: hypothetical protein J6R67_10950 [Treponema sp.]|nr:hypothetical protein [Treponema sp.]
MSPETEQQYKNQIAALYAEIEKLKNQHTKAIQRQQYGLNWIDVPEVFEKEAENAIPVLIEDKSKAIKNADGKPTHILIEGDNYHALTCLNYTHAGKIDVIYIDPPYNTGSDGFTYKDARFLDKFPNGKPVPKDDPLRHSTWLSFMDKRLRLAKNLLSDKGVIFISKYLEESSELDWWFKNGDSGKEFLGIKYFDTTDQTTRLFYPDWIIKLADGRICILDTKGGNTASSQETKDKAEELHRRITVLNRTSKRKYCGGIVIFANGQWYINDCEEYNYSGSNLTNLGWKTLAWKAL